MTVVKVLAKVAMKGACGMVGGAGFCFGYSLLENLLKAKKAATTTTKAAQAFRKAAENVNNMAEQMKDMTEEAEDIAEKVADFSEVMEDGA